MAKSIIQNEGIPGQKTKGQVFTPATMVNAMLDWCGYAGERILCRHVADNSCGNGAFLTAVVERYLLAARAAGLADAGIRRQLQLYIHGMDSDREAVAQCRRQLDAVTARHGITGVKWRVLYMDSLACRLFDGMMHYVVGNPPYVRLHHFQGITTELVHDYTFTDKGAADLYLAFFELGLRMLHPDGQLCYITPVSWVYSKAGLAMRRYIMEQDNLLELVDLGHHQLFAGVTTYTLVTRLAGRPTGKPFSYTRYLPETGCRQHVADLTLSDVSIGDTFCLADTGTLALLRSVSLAPANPSICVRNGFATLADSVFISDSLPESPFVIPVLKASTGQWSRCFYPYDGEGRPLSLKVLKRHPSVAGWLAVNRERLTQRDVRGDSWWLFGRSQAISSVAQPKLAVNALVRDLPDLKVGFADSGCGVYSGYYITAGSAARLDEIRAALQTDAFIRYVRALKKYKSGGYYTFSAGDVERYLHYCFPS